VNFDQAYDVVPVVTATPENFLDQANYRITNVTKNGFTIEVDPAQSRDIDFAWNAVQTQ
jgi:hypothetical protein